MKFLILFLLSVSFLAAEPIAPFLAKRYSGRAYDSNQMVTQAQIQSLIDAARSAPSCYNDQPWNFILCDRATDPAGFDKALQCLVPFNQGWAQNAALLVIAVAGNKFHHNQEQNDWGEYDTGAASFGMCLQATSIGLMAHQMGGFDKDKIVKDFNLPAGYKPMSVIAVGYEEVGKEDHSKKDRIAADQNFFLGNWGKAFK